MRTIHRLSFLVALAIGSAACSSSSRPSDAAIDGSMLDAGVSDAAMDASLSDGAIDAAMDASVSDAAMDAAMDASVSDAAMDAGDAQVDAGNVGAKVGSPCTMASQCDSHATPACLTTLRPLAGLAGVDPAFADLGLTFPNGYCSNAFPPYCASDAECGMSGKCYRPLSQVTAETLRQLEPPLGVSTGSLDFLPSFGVCLATCTATSDCSAGQVCNIPFQDFLSLIPGSVNDTPYCITIPGCESCDTNATCTLNYDGAGNNRCACKSGYTGDGMTCTAVSGACASNPCLNGGTCTNSGSSFTCACTGGYTGTTCDVAPALATVPIGGACTLSSECNVPNGGACYTSLRPLHGVLAGMSSPLENVGLSFSNGYCSNESANDWPPQATSYCVSDLQCGAHGGCFAPFRNVTPQTLRDLEASFSPALASGALDYLNVYAVCLRRCVDTFDCVANDACDVAMRDLTDQIPGAGDARTYCVPHTGCDLCDANAYCSVDAVGTGSCVCRAGYTGNGLTCMAKATPACTDAPCKNGAVCTDGPNQTYSCACTAGFTGTNCQIAQ